MGCKEKLETKEREHFQHLSHLGNRIRRLEKNVVHLVKLLDEEQLRQFAVSLIIAGDDIDLI